MTAPMMPRRTTRLALPHLPAVPAGGGGGTRPPLQPPPAPRRPAFFGGAGSSARPAASAHPLMAPMYWACADLLGLVPELAAARGGLPMPSELRATLEQQLSTVMTRARDAGIVPEDVIEAQYALVALVDEFLARVHGWPGQVEWRTKPLQLVRFNENTAGENFFRRMTALEGQPHRVHVLQIYFLCMAVGFQGRYAVAGGEGLAAIYERVGARVAQACGGDVISPHGDPRDDRGVLRLEMPIVRVGLGFFGFALLVFVVLRVVLGMQVRDTTRSMRDYTNGSNVAGATGR
jgi:type VI secretion system protein ImpK